MTQTPLRLVVFDVDGTLVDSQAHIVSSMDAAFAALGRPAPGRAATLSIVGLSLDIAIPKLAPDASARDHEKLVQGYKDAYMATRDRNGSAASSPFYPGARETLEFLSSQPDVLLGVATGKSKRGLDALIEGHGLEGMFVTRQVADFHPSKPHPSMLHTAMDEAGVGAESAVMIGDTTFDMDMARNAGIVGIGVAWGYHPTEALSVADLIAEDFADLQNIITNHWKQSA